MYVDLRPYTTGIRRCTSIYVGMIGYTLNLVTVDMFFDNKVEISENKNLLKIENRKKKKSKKSRQKSPKIYFS